MNREKGIRPSIILDVDVIRNEFVSLIPRHGVNLIVTFVDIWCLKVLLKFIQFHGTQGILSVCKNQTIHEFYFSLYNLSRLYIILSKY